MIRIFDKNYSEREVLDKTGNIRQICGTRHYELTEGSTKGTRAIDVNTGSGLCYTILPDRGMDISLASYKGMNLVYQTANGEVHPSYYDPKGMEWLRVFFAGLVTTCGLTYFSGPEKDGGEELGLHGRYTGIPAKKVCDLSGFEDGEYKLAVSGVVEEDVLFGHKLMLKRTIESKAGSKSLVIRDRAENMLQRSAPFTILYHINFGFPFLDESSEIFIKSKEVLPYDKKSEEAVGNWNKFETPDPRFKEQNFLHKMVNCKDGHTYAAVVNRSLVSPIGVYIKFNTCELPFLSEWKMAGQKDYVLALEPCNAPLYSRKKLRQEKLFPELGPYEVRNIEVEIGVLEGEEIAEFTKMLED